MAYKKEDVDHLINVIEKEFLNNLRLFGTLNHLTKEEQQEIRNNLDNAIGKITGKDYKRYQDFM